MDHRIVKAVMAKRLEKYEDELAQMVPTLEIPKDDASLAVKMQFMGVVSQQMEAINRKRELFVQETIDYLIANW